jgi:hypothetical protein
LLLILNISTINRESQKHGGGEVGMGIGAEVSHLSITCAYIHTYTVPPYFDKFHFISFRFASNYCCFKSVRNIKENDNEKQK